MRKLYGLPAQSDVALRINAAWAGMGQALRQFAALVQDEPLRVARLSVNDACDVAGVSVATANRFATALGYGGYADFRAALIQGFEDVFAPVEQLRRGRGEFDTPLAVMRTTLLEDSANLARSEEGLTEDVVNDVVARIVKARRIYVAGFDVAGHLAGIFAAGLNLIGCDAQSGSGGGGSIGAIRMLMNYGPEDLVIAIAFPHYFRETLHITAHVAKRGVPVVAITDGLSSPLARMAEVSLFAAHERTFNGPSSTAIMGMLDALVAAVAAVKPDAMEAREKFAAETYPWMIAGHEWED